MSNIFPPRKAKFIASKEVRRTLISAVGFGVDAVVAAYEGLPTGAERNAARKWLFSFELGTWQRKALAVIEGER